MDRTAFREAAQRMVDEMTIEEAASQLLHHSPAIDRLGIPEYNWWNEGLHGVARAGTATVFPQAISAAASFDPELLKREAEIVAEEARAKYNAAQAEQDIDLYKGLTLWSPNINIFRDPRWGRGHETYGEDPFLTKTMGNAFVSGLQGNGRYLKTAACAKHLAVHSGPESLRHSFNAVVSEKDLRETYLPAFESAVKDSDVEAVMGAYNRVNGEPACGSIRLLRDILRGECGFQGHVVSDCFAVKDFHEQHKYTFRPAESASLAVRAGCDLNCGCTYEHLLEGLKEGLVTAEEIRKSAVRVMTTRFALGMFDPECEYNQIPYTVVGHLKHRELALRAAEESIVLLKNTGILPLDRKKVNTVAVIGPNAYSTAVLHANYHGDSDAYITNLEGIRKAAGDSIRVLYSKGCDLYRHADDPLCKPGRLFSEAITVAKYADVVILCVGLDETLEGEQGDAGNSFASGDKDNLLLPEVQCHLIEKILQLNKPVILVINSGSALDLSAYESKVSAIVQCWYSGQSGGEALGNILFGKANPFGRLPVTFYYDAQPLPEFTDYRMAGRTYKFMTAAPWYPFGYGLSYTEFAYQNLSVVAGADRLTVTVDISNTGMVAGAEVTQCYVRYEGTAFEKPRYQLVGFHRTDIPAGDTVSTTLVIPKKELCSVLENGDRVLLDGTYVLYVGSSQPDARSVELTKQKPLAIRFCVRDAAITVGDRIEEDTPAYPDGNCYAAKMESKRRYSLQHILSPAPIWKSALPE
jgi:beta-glucosidase